MSPLLSPTTDNSMMCPECFPDRVAYAISMFAHCNLLQLAAPSDILNLAYPSGAWLQRYREAVQNEDFGEAARLRDYGGVGLLGWWWPQSSNTDNPSHLLRIVRAYNRYMFLAYKPSDIAHLHVCHPLSDRAQPLPFPQDSLYHDRNTCSLTRLLAFVQSGNVTSKITSPIAAVSVSALYMAGYHAIELAFWV